MKRQKRHSIGLVPGFLLLLLATQLISCVTQETRQGPTPLSEAEINIQLALRHLRDDEVEQALARVNQALKQEPELVSANSLAGLLYEKIDRPDVAASFFQKAIMLAPHDAAVRNNYGKLLCNLGRLQEADAEFMQAARSPGNRSPEIAYTNAGLCALRAPDPGRAETNFIAALQANANMPVARYQLAHSYQQQGRHIQAQNELRQYLAIAEHTAQTLWLAIIIERGLGNNDAVELYSQQLKLQFPDSDEYLLLMQTEAQPVYAHSAPPANNDLRAASTSNITASATALIDQQSIRKKPNKPLQKKAWLLAQDPRHYTVQLMSGSNESAIKRFYEQNQLPQQIAYYAIKNKDSLWYTMLYGSFSGFSKAREAINQLPVNLRNKQPWVRSFDSIQKEIRANQSAVAE